MENYLIDCRGNTLKAVHDLRVHLQLAGTGRIINLVCDESQIIRILREITDFDGAITAQETRPDGVYIAVRKR